MASVQDHNRLLCLQQLFPGDHALFELLLQQLERVLTAEIVLVLW